MLIVRARARANPVLRSVLIVLAVLIVLWLAWLTSSMRQTARKSTGDRDRDRDRGRDRDHDRGRDRDRDRAREHDRDQGRHKDQDRHRDPYRHHHWDRVRDRDRNRDRERNQDRVRNRDVHVAVRRGAATTPKHAEVPILCFLPQRRQRVVQLVTTTCTSVLDLVLHVGSYAYNYR